MSDMDVIRERLAPWFAPEGAADEGYPHQIDGGWRLGETETHYIDVLVMLVNDRVICTPKALPTTYDRFWCYPQGGPAFHAAMLWDWGSDTEPVGWIKSYDGRYASRP